MRGCSPSTTSVEPGTGTRSVPSISVKSRSTVAAWATEVVQVNANKVAARPTPSCIHSPHRLFLGLREAYILYPIYHHRGAARRKSNGVFETTRGKHGPSLPTGNSA